MARAAPVPPFPARAESSQTVRTAADPAASGYWRPERSPWGHVISEFLGFFRESINPLGRRHTKLGTGFPFADCKAGTACFPIRSKRPVARFFAGERLRRPLASPTARTRREVPNSRARSKSGLDGSDPYCCCQIRRIYTSFVTLPISAGRYATRWTPTRLRGLGKFRLGSLARMRRIQRWPIFVCRSFCLIATLNDGLVALCPRHDDSASASGHQISAAGNSK